MWCIFWGKSSKYDCNNQQVFINILKTVGDNIDKKIKYVKIYPGYKIYSNLKIIVKEMSMRKIKTL